MFKPLIILTLHYEKKTTSMQLIFKQMPIKIFLTNRLEALYEGMSWCLHVYPEKHALDTSVYIVPSGLSCLCNKLSSWIKKKKKKSNVTRQPPQFISNANVQLFWGEDVLAEKFCFISKVENVCSYELANYWRVPEALLFFFQKLLKSWADYMQYFTCSLWGAFC